MVISISSILIIGHNSRINLETEHEGIDPDVKQEEEEQSPLLNKESPSCFLFFGRKRLTKNFLITKDLQRCRQKWRWWAWWILWQQQWGWEGWATKDSINLQALLQCMSLLQYLWWTRFDLPNGLYTYLKRPIRYQSGMGRGGGARRENEGGYQRSWS